MAKEKKFSLNRKQYNEVRKMDHTQMNEWAEKIFDYGYKVGADQNKGITDQEIREALSTVKGIGEKKIEAIMEATAAKR